MKLKRSMASLSAGLEDFVAQVENHEAVAACMIDDVRHAAARVRARSARVQTQITRLQRQRAELDTERQRWNNCALTLASSEEAKALECVHRARQADIRLSAVEAQLCEHLRLADELTSRLGEIEERLSELRDTAGGIGRTTRIALTSCARRGPGVEGGASQRSY